MGVDRSPRSERATRQGGAPNLRIPRGGLRRAQCKLVLGRQGRARGVHVACPVAPSTRTSRPPEDITPRGGRRFDRTPAVLVSAVRQRDRCPGRRTSWCGPAHGRPITQASAGIQGAQRRSSTRKRVTTNPRLAIRTIATVGPDDLEPLAHVRTGSCTSPTPRGGRSLPVAAGATRRARAPTRLCRVGDKRESPPCGRSSPRGRVMREPSGVVRWGTSCG